MTSDVARPCWNSSPDAVVFQEQLWTWDCAWEYPSTLKIADLWICKTEKFRQWFADGFVTGNYGTFTLVHLAPVFLAQTLLEVDAHGTTLWLAHVSQFSASNFVSVSASCGQWKIQHPQLCSSGIPSLESALLLVPLPSPMITAGSEHLGSNLHVLSELYPVCTLLRYDAMVANITFTFAEKLKTCRGRQQWLTSLAGAYPPALCRLWAKVVGAAAPSCAWRQSDDKRMSSQWESDLQQQLGASWHSIGRMPACPLRFKLPFNASGKSWGADLSPLKAKNRSQASSQENP
jgi:hypothetical protein